MASKSEIEELRTVARSRHKAVTAKINRIRKSAEVEVGGSKYDPRRDVAKIGRYNTRQLQDYISQLNGFTDRKTQFVPDAHKKPIPRAGVTGWSEYKREERKYNAKVNAAFDKVKHLFNPRSGMTLEARMNKMMASRKQAGNRSVNSAYDPPSRNSRTANGEKGLLKMIQEMKTRNERGWMAKNLQRDRDSFRKMLVKMNVENGALWKLLDELTPKQFAVVWQYTTLPDALTLNYENYKLLLNDHDAAFNPDQFNDNIEEVGKLLEYGKTLFTDDEPVAPGTKKKSKPKAVKPPKSK